MVFERRYQFNVLSKQFNKSALRYSTLIQAPLDPWFLTGFADAEGCFSVLVQPNQGYKTNWRVKAIFAISLHKKDIALLKQFKDTIGVGFAIGNNGDKVTYRVEAIKDLEVIINHFSKYPLVTVKRLHFNLFKECFEIIKRGEHRSENGFFKIISLKYLLNRGLPENLSKAFPCIIPTPKPVFVFKGIPHPLWLSGFSSGDGSFNLKIGKGTTSIGTRIQLRFGIGLHPRELEVIKGIAVYLRAPVGPKGVEGEGDTRTKYIAITPSTVVLSLSNFSQIINCVIPFFKQYPVQGLKGLDFEDFCLVARLVENKEHLTGDGMAKILKIRDRMNQRRPWGLS